MAFNASNINWGGVASSGAEFIGGLMKKSAVGQVADTSAEESEMKNIGDWDISQVNDNDTLQTLYQQVDNTGTMFNPKAWYATGKQAVLGMLGEGLQGMSSGASFGTSIYPGIGTAIGAAAGLTLGTLKAGVENRLAGIQAHNLAATLHNIGERKKYAAKKEIAEESMNLDEKQRDTDLLHMGAEGGPLYTDDYFTNGVRFITTGGSHEQNPFGGVQQGIARDGLPNLVEEGEVIYNDYVFSKRLKVPKSDKKLLGLKDNKEYSFADAAEIIQKESEERPNDPLSTANLEVMMGRLEGSQEYLKQKQEEKRFKREFSKLSPEEQLGLLESMSAPQYALGGHLYPDGGNVMLDDWWEVLDDSSKQGRRVVRPAVESFDEWWDKIQKLPVRKTEEVTVNPTPEDEDTEEHDLSGAKISQAGQILRGAPILGSLLGTASAMADQPNYANIARTEHKVNQIPVISPKALSNRMAYEPIDINYIATQLANQGIGTRRAVQEATSNRGSVMNALLAAGYQSQLAQSDALVKAMQANLAQKQQVEEFNRGTDQTNAQLAWDAARQNQLMDYHKANVYLTTGQLRDQELARLQEMRSAQLTNLFQNIGNYGQDLVARGQVKANADSGVYGTLSPELKAAVARELGLAAKGGPLFTIKKKGGKHA